MLQPSKRRAVGGGTLTTLLDRLVQLLDLGLQLLLGDLDLIQEPVDIGPGDSSDSVKKMAGDCLDLFKNEKFTDPAGSTNVFDLAAGVQYNLSLLKYMDER